MPRARVGALKSMSPLESGALSAPGPPCCGEDPSGLSSHGTLSRAKARRLPAAGSPECSALHVAELTAGHRPRKISTPIQPPNPQTSWLAAGKQPPQTPAGPGCGAPSQHVISGCNELEITAASGTQLTPSWPGPAGVFASQESSFPPSMGSLTCIPLPAQSEPSESQPEEQSKLTGVRRGFSFGIYPEGVIYFRYLRHR